ncbi:hypothetical protein [Peribacillus alkalitolerans]|uniref:hypothetical protein n=1 Tax=Peribacillus alkalitolerans TaxID=1550385 RepID=UPI0013D22E6A|nr:hypothetical protein [Peribacillus alkalitolerans]
MKLNLKKIVEDLKHSDPDVRMDAIDELQEMQEDDELEVKHVTLEWLAKEAAYPYHAPTDNWDDPSFQLVDFISQFRVYELIDTLVANYPKYSLAAKDIAIRYICSWGDHKSEMAILDILEQNIKSKEVIFPLDALFEHPSLVKKILDKYYTQIENLTYKETFYKILSYSLDNDLVQQFKPGYIMPILIGDYNRNKTNYLTYNNNYNVNLVYKKWKNQYLRTRYNMATLLSLMEYYFTSETEVLVKEAVLFSDPIIKASAVITSLQKNVSIEEEVLLECATNIESSEMFYTELLRIRKEHLFPIKEGKQHFFAKSHLFDFLLAEYDVLAEKIDIIDKVETENHYKQPIRYYLARYENDNKLRPAWIGAYALEEDDDSVHMWEGTYTEAGMFDDHTVDEHIYNFMKNREEDNEEDNNTVYYLSKPKFSKWFYFLYVVLAFRGYQVLSTMDPGYLILTSILAILVVGYHLYRITQTKNTTVSIIGRELVYSVKDHDSSINLHEIKKIMVEKANFKTRFWSRRAKVVSVYNKKNKLALQLPLHSVRYDEFAYSIEEMTGHLKETPYIEQYQD